MESAVDIRERLRRSAQPESLPEFDAPDGRNRPRAMELFDRLYVFILALSATQILFSLPVYEQLVMTNPVLRQAGMTTEWYVAQAAIGLLIALTAWFLTSRLKWRVGRWLCTLLLLSTATTRLFQSLGVYESLPLPVSIIVLSWAQAILAATMLCLLYAPSSRAWFRTQ
jgi:hypothetical protein